MRYCSLALLLALAVSEAKAQATWTVDSMPMLDVPGLASDGTLTFAYAAGATRLADGTLLIADRGENAVRVVDAAGRLRRSSGGTGDGPGEFQSMIWAGRCGDSLLVWDLRRRMASLIGASGAIARQFAVPAGDTAQMPMQFACSPRGTTGTMVYRGVPRPIRGAMNPRIPNVISVTAAVYPPLDGYALPGCTVGPGFDFADFTLLADEPEKAAIFRSRWPELASLV
jgi:hypothetical protein